MDRHFEEETVSAQKWQSKKRRLQLASNELALSLISQRNDEIAALFESVDFSNQDVLSVYETYFFKVLITRIGTSALEALIDSGLLERLCDNTTSTVLEAIE